MRILQDELEDESPIGSKPINVESNKVNGVDKDGETSASGLSRYEKISLEKLVCRSSKYWCMKPRH